MHARKLRVLLRHYLERGLSKAEIARELGVARRTIYHWIATGQLERELDDAPVRYAARPPVARVHLIFFVRTRMGTFTVAAYPPPHASSYPPRLRLHDSRFPVAPKRRCARRS